MVYEAVLAVVKFQSFSKPLSLYLYLLLLEFIKLGIENEILKLPWLCDSFIDSVNGKVCSKTFFFVIFFVVVFFNIQLG